MSQTLKPKNPDRGQRHSAAWGKRLSMLLLLLIAQTAFAEHGNTARRTAGKFAPDLAAVAAQARRPRTAASQTIRVIVQYKQAPLSEQVGRMQRLGGRVSTRLSLVKGIALTIPVSALAGLEADPDVLSVSIDHPLQVLDDQTDTPTNIRAAWNAGFDGTGIGVAVIDSGVNDYHPDLWDSTETYTRVVYHQDFTGTATSNSSGAKYDLFGHGT